MPAPGTLPRRPTYGPVATGAKNPGRIPLDTWKATLEGLDAEENLTLARNLLRSRRSARARVRILGRLWTRVSATSGILALTAGLPVTVWAEDGGAAAPLCTVPRTDSAIRIDGILDEGAWDRAALVDLPYEIMPGENIPAPVSTECLVTHDDRYLYVGFRAYDPDPTQIRAHFCDRDKAYRNDYVGFMVDPFNDGRRGFEFFCNPFGVQMDFSRDDLASENQEDGTWDAIWESSGRITDEGYVAEMAVPFTALRFPRTDGEQTWGFMAFRAYPRTDRHQIGSFPYDRNRDCMVCQWDKIRGFEGITPGRNLEISPTFTAHRTDQREDFPSGPLADGDPDPELGISARWGITPNWSVNTAVNPDFSQVEADVAQLEINTRYALYYPEKRPFFMEGADIFRSPVEAVYTRSVIEPLVGLKISGKEGKNAVGVFATRDEVTNLIFPSNEGSEVVTLDQDVTTGVLRYRRDVGRTSTVGLLLTAREGDGYRNRVYGIDGILRPTAPDLIRFQFLGSMTNYPLADARENDQPLRVFDGFGSDATYIHSGRDWAWWAYWDDRDPGFRADAGYIGRVDLNQYGAGGQRNWWPEPEAFLNRVTLGVEGERTENHGGVLTDEALAAFLQLEGPWQSWLNVRLRREREYYEADTHDLNAGNFFFNIRPTGDFTCSLGGDLGNAVDYDNARKGNRVRLYPGLTLDLFRHVYLQLDHTFERFTVDGERLFDAHLHQARLVYQFNIRTFARAIVQYVDIDRNVDLYLDEETEPEERDLFTQFLFSYKINPQTVLFLGYSDNREGERGIDLTQTDRTFFFKVGYAWVQ